jgi:hypothetical protein
LKTGNSEIREIHEKKKIRLVHKEESYRIIGACFEVFKEKGCGFLEAGYQECLALEFNRQKIPYFAPLVV